MFLSLLLSVALAQDYVTLGLGKAEGISGLVVRGTDGGVATVVVVNDVKGNGTAPPLRQIRLRGGEATATELVWQGERPIDLEAIANIPGAEADVLVVQSNGLAIRVTLGEGTASAAMHWTLPDAHELEGAVVVAGEHGDLTVIYGNRGEKAVPSTLYAADLHADGTLSGQGEVGSFFHMLAPKKVPGDAGSVRHVADLAFDAQGTLWAVGAFDPGDDGPFNSELYPLGLWDGAHRRILPAAKARHRCATGVKIEGLAFVAGEAFVGRDSLEAWRVLDPR
jgi:hypothetical protein